KGSACRGDLAVVRGACRERPCGHLARTEHHLHAAVLLVAEHLVGAGRLVEAHPVRDYEGGTDPARLDLPEWRPQVAVAVRLAHLPPEALVDRAPNGDLGG